GMYEGGEGVLCVAPAVVARDHPVGSGGSEAALGLNGHPPLVHSWPRNKLVVGLSTPNHCRGLLIYQPDHSVGGFGRDIMVEVGKALGLEIEFVELDSRDAIAALNSGEVDAVSLMSVLDDRLDRVGYTAPVVVARGAMLMRNGEKPPADMTELGRLRLTVASFGVAHQWCASHGLAINPNRSLRDAMMDVRDGRADVCITTQIAGRVDMETYHIAGLTEHPLNDGGLWRAYALAVRTGDSDLLADLNAAMAVLRQNGRFDAIYDATVGPYQPREAPKTVDARSAVMMGVLLSAIAAAWCVAWVLSARRLRERTQALSARESDLTRLAESFPGVFYKYTLTHDGRRVPGYMNAHGPQWERLFENFKLFGDFRETLLPRMHPDDRERYIAATSQSKESGSGLDIEYRLLDRNMRYHWIHSRIVPLETHEGTDWQGLLLDVTELRTAQYERQRLTEQLAHSQRLESLGLMAGGIAHDFNNLLTAMSGQIEFAVAKLPAGSTSSQHIDAARGGIRRAADLAKQLLSFSGKDPHSKVAVDLGSTVDLLLPLLATNVPPGVALRPLQQDQPVYCLADRVQLEQVVMNLISNAAEACGPEGSVWIEVSTRSMDAAALSLCTFRAEAKPGQFACLSVQDDGSGITQEALARIFEPFFSTKFAGRGLGLAVVATIVRRHGGAIAVTSTPGEGSNFRVYLPACEVSAQIAAATVTVPQSGSVLVIDQEPTLRAVAAHMLELKGWRCVQAADAESALAHLASDPDGIAFALVDSSLANAPECELLSELRRFNPSLPLVLMEDHASVLPHEQGAIHLGKPFSAAQLQVAADQAIRTAVHS
ncbi:MAG: transporter substrate-binding domain-containing protein, partial [Planctomycetota bacterium]|nr:transporter substrate-binding domain-containing protein [Planctomycetota bacterium]